MTSLIRTAIALIAMAAVALALAVAPAAAKSPANKPACWKVLLNDWYDGTISGKYPIGCYRDAISRIRANPDLSGYTSAVEDITRAMQKRIAEIAAAKNKKNTAPAVAPSKGNGNNSTPSGPSGGNKGGPGPTKLPAVSSNKHPNARPGHKTPTHQTNPGKVQVNPSVSPTQQQTPAKPSVSTKPRSNSEPDSKGRQTHSGPLSDVAQALGPKDATSLPIPLLVLGGIALLLMAAGAASLIAKRAQGRRVPVPVRSGPPARQSR